MSKPVGGTKKFPFAERENNCVRIEFSHSYSVVLTMQEAIELEALLTMIIDGHQRRKET